MCVMLAVMRSRGAVAGPADFTLAGPERLATVGRSFLPVAVMLTRMAGNRIAGA